MKYRVEIAGPAILEMEDAFSYLHERSPAAAFAWLEGLQAAISTLDHFPRRCPLARESDAFPQEVRQLLYGGNRPTYRVLFTIEDRVVRVLHLRHAARRPIEP